MVVDVGLENKISQDNNGYKGNEKLFSKFYTKENLNGYDMFSYEFRNAEIKDDKGNTLFLQENIESPKEWTDKAVSIVASRYFKRKNVKKEYGGNDEGSEQSIKNLI